MGTCDTSKPAKSYKNKERSDKCSYQIVKTRNGHMKLVDHNKLDLCDTDKIRQRIYEYFIQHDTNKDGLLQQKEVKQLLTAFYQNHNKGQ